MENEKNIYKVVKKKNRDERGNLEIQHSKQTAKNTTKY